MKYDKKLAQTKWWDWSVLPNYNNSRWRMRLRAMQLSMPF